MLAFLSDDLEPIIILLLVILLLSVLVVITLPLIIITETFGILDSILLDHESLHLLIHSFECVILVKAALLDLRVKLKQTSGHISHTFRILFHKTELISKYLSQVFFQIHLAGLIRWSKARAY